MAKPSAEQESLKARQYALTRGLLLDAGVALLRQAPLAELTMRAAARQAGVAERTAFRHFATREELLDALAVEVSRRLELPALPASAAELPTVPRGLCGAFEAQASLTRAALQSELFERIRSSVAHDRWRAVQVLVDAYAPERTQHERALAAANIRYLLPASTWNYYRAYFGFSLDDSIAAAEQAIALFLEALAGPRRKAR